MSKSAALVYPYFLTTAKVHKLFQPLGIACLAAQLQELSIDTVQYDCTFDSFDSVIEKITKQNPCIVGIYCMVTMSENAIRLLRKLRETLPTTLFVAGGPLPTIYPERFAKEFDVVFRGESDIAFPSFCKSYSDSFSVENFKSRMDFGSFPGIYLKDGEKIIQNGAVHYPISIIDALPLPDRGGVDYRKYQDAWATDTGSKTATIMLTRGCPFSCDFCSKPIFGNDFRKRSIESVKAEIKQIRDLGFNQLWIADDSFTLDESFVVDFCEMMMKENNGLTWSCLSRVTGITSSPVSLMKKSGCVKVYLGLESGCDETLKLMNKKATVTDGENAVRLFHAAGIQTSGFFIVGYPGESRASVERTFEHSLNLDLDEISFSVPYPLPGSPLYSRLSEINYTNDWSFENEVKFLYKSEFDTEEINTKIENTYKLFNENKKRCERSNNVSDFS